MKKLLIFNILLSFVPLASMDKVKDVLDDTYYYLVEKPAEKLVGIPYSLKIENTSL